VTREGNGLAGMRERIVALQGTLQISTTPQGGTCIAASVPMPVTPKGTHSVPAPFHPTSSREAS